MYIVYGFVAFYCGIWLMWTYGKLDSIRFPIQTCVRAVFAAELARYGDLGGRVIGTWFQFGVNLLQFIQLIINTSTLVLNNGENLELIVQG